MSLFSTTIESGGLTPESGWSIEKLTWTITPEARWLRRNRPKYNFNFFKNLKVLELHGLNNEIEQMLRASRTSHSVEELQLYVFGSIGSFVPFTFYEDLPELLSHLFPRARIKIDPGPNYGKKGPFAGRQALWNSYDGHLDGSCFCSIASGEPLFYRTFQENNNK